MFIGGVLRGEVEAPAARNDAESNVGVGMPTGGMPAAALPVFILRRLTVWRFVDHCASSGTVPESHRIAV